MTKTINIAIAGAGVVGKGTYEILTEQIDLLNKRSKNNLKLVAISSRSKKDFIDEKKVKLYSNALDLAKADNVDIIVELIGGSEGIAYDLCKEALANKKHFVTANKALIATHGFELAKLAEKNNVALQFEAGVAGAIPILKSLKEGLVANKVSKIYGILNGTGNYILTKMEENNVDFEVVLKEAQELGYAEADPTFDVEGIDSAHKLAILAAIAQNSKIDFDALHIEGISKISIEDIHFAGELDYKIKSFGVFEAISENEIRQAVYPCLISSDTQIANVSDSYNAVLTKGSNSDWNFLVGRGAGSKPTASAVVADILDITNERFNFPFGASTKDLKEVKTANISNRTGKYYLRFEVEKDFAKENDLINKIFGSEDVVDKTVIKAKNDKTFTYALTTKQTKETKINSYLKKLQDTTQITNINSIRIEEI